MVVYDACTPTLSAPAADDRLATTFCGPYSARRVFLAHSSHWHSVRRVFRTVDSCILCEGLCVCFFDQVQYSFSARDGATKEHAAEEEMASIFLLSAGKGTSSGELRPGGSGIVDPSDPAF